MRRISWNPGLRVNRILIIRRASCTLLKIEQSAENVYWSIALELNRKIQYRFSRELTETLWYLPMIEISMCWHNLVQSWISLSGYIFSYVCPFQWVLPWRLNPFAQVSVVYPSIRNTFQNFRKFLYPSVCLSVLSEFAVSRPVCNAIQKLPGSTVLIGKSRYINHAMVASRTTYKGSIPTISSDAYLCHTLLYKWCIAQWSMHSMSYL